MTNTTGHAQNPSPGDDRALNRRERLEHECEERALETTDTVMNDKALLRTLIEELSEEEQDRVATQFWLVATGKAAGDSVLMTLRHLAYRRALAAERRKEGLE